MAKLKFTELDTDLPRNLVALQLANNINATELTTPNVSNKLHKGFEPLNDDDVTQIIQCNMLAILNQTWFSNERPDEDDSGNFVFKVSNNGLTLAAKGIKDIKELGTGSTVHRLWNALLVEFTQRKTATITISLKEFMQLCGLANTQHNKENFVKQIKGDLALINKLWLSFKEKNESLQQTTGKKRRKNSKAPPLWMKSFSDQKLCDSCKLENGLITFELTEFFYRYLISCNFMCTFKSIFKLDLRRYRNAPYLGYKLLHYRNMKNKDKAKNKNKLISLRLSVENLLLSSPFFKSLLMGNLKGQGAKRIQEPFEAAMDALTCIKNWQYCEGSGGTLSDKKLQNLNYHEFSRLYVEYKVDYNEKD